MNKKREFRLGIKAQQRLIAVGTGLLFCLLFLLLFATKGRGKALTAFFIAPLTSSAGWSEMIGSATTLIFIAIGVSVMYQCHQYSLISEGSFLIGACVSSLFLLNNNTKPSGYLIVVALLLGTVAGSLAAFIPARLHAKHGVNLTLASAIVNFFILELTTWLLERFMADPAAGGAVSFSIPARMRLPQILHLPSVRLGTLLALVAALLTYIVLYRTKRGYEIRTVGASQSLASYVGLSSAGILLFSQTFGGAMAGLGGAVQMMGISPRYLWDGAFSNIGFTGIIVALLADCNPAWVPVSALLFGYLNTGGLFLQQSTGISSALAGLSQAIILLVLFASKYFYRKNPFASQRVSRAPQTPHKPRKEGGTA